MANDPANDAARDGEAKSARAGEQLRAARERRKLTQAQAASEMRIDLATLRALEADDFTRLGAPIFVKGHLRNYAKQLGIAVEPLLEAYERAAQPAPPPLVGYRNEGEQMEGRVEFKRMLPTVAAGVTSVLLVLFTVWLYHRPEPLTTPGPVPAAASAPAVTAPAPTTAAPVAGSVASAPAPAPAQAGAAAAPANATPAGGTARAEPQRADPARTDPPRVDAPATDPKPALAVGQVRIALRFSAESWVEVYDPANQPLVYQLFDAGQTREFTATPPLRVFIGQAGSVAVTIDGKRVDIAPLTKRDATARFTIGAGGAVR
jgi:cytoskeleton protein RodZ